MNLITNNTLYERVIKGTISDLKYIQLNENSFIENTKIIPEFFWNCYNFSFNKFLENKMFGVGPKISRELFRLEIEKQLDKKEYERYNPCISHPHNFYIQLLLETGLLGTTPIIVIFFFVIYKILSLLYLNIKDYSEITFKKIFIYNAFFITLFPLIPTGNFFSSHLNILIYLPLGFIFYLSTKND